MLGAVTPSRIVRWINETRRIRVGDCADVPWPEQSIRIEVEDIRVAEIPDCYGQYRQAKICADKQVSIGGAVVYGGMSTTDHQVNRALLPRAESYEEPAASLFSFHASDRHFSFVGFIVTHINQHDHVVDVNVVAVRLFR